MIRLAALTLSLLLLAPTYLAAQPSTPQSVQENQQRFEQAAMRMFAGDYAQAAAMFEALYRDTGSPRVRLEWARSLYLEGDLEKSRELFLDALQANPPVEVQDAVIGFLRDIRRAQPHWDLSFGLVSESNPRAAAETQVIYIWGLPFEYRAPADTGTQRGLGYNLVRVMPVQNTPWTFFAGVSGVKFSRSEFDRMIFDADIEYRIKGQADTRFQLGYESGVFDGERLYNFPSFGIQQQRVLNLAKTQLLLDWRASYGKLDYIDIKDQSGPVTNLSAGLQIAPYPGGVLGARLDWGAGDIRDRAYAYETVGGTLSWSHYLPAIPARVTLSAARFDRKFKDVFPIFDIVRNDQREVIQLQVDFPRLRFQGFTARLDLGSEHNTSTVPIYSYRKRSVNFAFVRDF